MIGFRQKAYCITLLILAMLTSPSTGSADTLVEYFDTIWVSGAVGQNDLQTAYISPIGETVFTLNERKRNNRGKCPHV